MIQQHVWINIKPVPSLLPNVDLRTKIYRYSYRYTGMNAGINTGINRSFIDDEYR